MDVDYLYLRVCFRSFVCFVVRLLSLFMFVFFMDKFFNIFIFRGKNRGINDFLFD